MRKIELISLAITLSAIFLLLFTGGSFANTPEKDPSVMVEVVEEVYGPVPTEPPFDVPVLSENELLYLLRHPPQKHALPPDLMQEVRDAVERKIDNGNVHIVYVDGAEEISFRREKGEPSREYHVLAAVVPDNGDPESAEHFEVTVSENVLEIVELHPEFIEAFVENEVIAEYETTEKEETATIVVTKGIRGYQLKLQTATTLSWYSAYTEIKGKNIFGMDLWRLTAAGYFYICYPYYVLDVINTSDAWARGWLGWSVDYFYSYYHYHPSYWYGQVDAYARFDGPLQDVYAWAWVRMYGDTTTIGDADTY